MKSTMRILLAGAAVLILVLGAWNVAFAEDGPAASGPAANARLFFSSLFRKEAEKPGGGPALQAAEDNPDGAQSSETPDAIDTPEATGTREVDDSGQSSSDSNHELSGTVSAVVGNSITVNGQTFILANGTEGAGSVQAGDRVKLELVTNADGTITVRELKITGNSGNQDHSAGSGDDSSGDDHGGSGSGSGGSDDGGNDGGGGSGG